MLFFKKNPIKKIRELTQLNIKQFIVMTHGLLNLNLHIRNPSLHSVFEVPTRFQQYLWKFVPLTKKNIL